MAVDGSFYAVAAWPAFLTDAVEPPPCRVFPDKFTDWGDRGRSRARRVALAKAICRTCPLLDQCREWAVEKRQVGVWGGTDETQRGVIRRERGRRATAA